MDVQTSDTNGLATPGGWPPGVDVIVPPPGTAEAPETADTVDKREGQGCETLDWSCSTRAL